MDITPIFIKEEFYSHAENLIVLEIQMNGKIKAIRQYPIGQYFADFYFPDINVVLEIDGVSHGKSESMEHDNVRDKFMNKKGYTVVRVNGKYAKENPSGILNSLRLFPKGKTYLLGSENELKFLQQLSIGIIPK